MSTNNLINFNVTKCRNYKASSDINCQDKVIYKLAPKIKQRGKVIKEPYNYSGKDDARVRHQNAVSQVVM